MDNKIEFYFSFRSPYSYLAFGRLVEIADRFSCDIDLKIVRPLALREPGFFKNGRPQFVPYLLKDIFREGERLSIPLQFPNPDPIKMDLASGQLDADQPLMDMLLQLGFAALSTGDGISYIRAMAHLIWGGSVRWDQKEQLEKMALSTGHNHAELLDWAQAHSQQIEATLLDNEQAQLVYHWGVPLMVFQGEPFFGQDRLDALQWRLEQKR